MTKEKIKTQLKNLDLELGNLKIVTTKQPDEYDRVMTGVDVDVFIDGKNFRDTPLSKLSAIRIDIGDANTIAEVTYVCCPYVKKKDKD